MKNQISLFQILILTYITFALSLITPQKVFAVPKTLNDWGIPDWKGKRNIFSSFEEHSLKVPGKETRFKVYEVEKVSVGVYTINGRIYAVTADFDNKEPLDLAVMDFFGKGLFEEISPGNSFQAPTWALGVGERIPDKDLKFGELVKQAKKLNPYKNPDSVIILLEKYKDKPLINNQEYFNQLGLAYQNKKRTLEAITMYQKGLALNPNHPNLNFNLGVSYTFNADYGDAIKRFKLYKKLKPQKSSRTEKWIAYIQDQVN
jgi:tetratricopeptide (TPR) repeat protein